MAQQDHHVLNKFRDFDDMYLCQFHLFTHSGYWYLYHVESGNAYRISSDLFGIMRKLGKQELINIADLDQETIEILSELRLIRNQNTKLNMRQCIKEQMVTGLSLNIIQKCNMECVYCYAGQGTYGSPGFMSEQVAVSAIDYLLDITPGETNLSLIFFGGEPLLNFSLIKRIVEYTETNARAKQKNFHYSITTNGSLFNRRIINFLNRYKFSVTVSIDGDRKIQNRNRPLNGGKNSFQIVNRGTKKFLKTRQGNAMGRATITSENTNLERISTYIMRMGFNRFDYALVTADKSALYSLSDFQYRRLIQDSERQAEATIKSISEGGNVTYTRITDMTKKLRSVNKRTSYCGAAKNFVAVSTSGELYPCHRFVGMEHWKIGDVSGLRTDVWDKEFKVAGIANEVCLKCWARFLCGGGCLHDNYVFSGKLHHPDPRNCAEIKHRIEMAIYVYDRLKYLMT